KTATGATVHLDLSGTLYPAGDHPWQLTFSDTSPTPQTVTVKGAYTVNPFPADTMFVIEAEDYNYENGKTKPEASVMPYKGGAYPGVLGVLNVDYFNNDGNDNGGTGTVGGDSYRHEDMPAPDTNPHHVDITPNSGRYGTDRVSYQMDVNYRIGW